MLAHLVTSHSASRTNTTEPGAALRVTVSLLLGKGSPICFETGGDAEPSMDKAKSRAHQYGIANPSRLRKSWSWENPGVFT
jgi:hypothetical protein